MNIIDLSVFDCAIRVEYWDRRAGALLNGNYSGFEKSIRDPQISYRITHEGMGEERVIARKGACTELARDDAEFLYMFEKDMTIETQKLRRDLYFLHAAVLELDGQALALVAPSGYGKSTTTWGLLHHGLKYLSDELAPICLETMRVHPFPHAVCLKEAPPENYPLPKETIFTTRAAHVPTQFLPGPTIIDPISLEAIFFVRFVSDISAPILAPLGKGEAAARLFTNALNPLAHGGEGLDGAIEIASRTHCFEMLSANLPRTCELIKSAVLSIRS